MPRIPPLEREKTTGEARATFDRELAKFGRLTNMKRTLLHSPINDNSPLKLMQKSRQIGTFRQLNAAPLYQASE